MKISSEIKDDKEHQDHENIHISEMKNTEIVIFQLEDFLKGYEEQEASVWIDLTHEGKYMLHLVFKKNI